jgi:hypothetical protein
MHAYMHCWLCSTLLNPHVEKCGNTVPPLFPQFNFELMYLYLLPMMQTNWGHYFGTACWVQNEWMAEWGHCLIFWYKMCIKSFKLYYIMNLPCFSRRKFLLRGNISKVQFIYLWENLSKKNYSNNFSSET